MRLSTESSSKFFVLKILLNLVLNGNRAWPMRPVQAPFVVISLVLTMVAGFGMMNTFLYFMLATMHAASCAGDFYYTYLLLVKFAKGNIAVEDTETGLIIYQA